jgi:cytoskeletal protein CcmA (bactofilin family)
MLTVGPGAAVTADISAKILVLNGSVTGNVTAAERFEIKTGGKMNGNLVCPNVVMNEGSEFTGGIDMRRKQGAGGGPVDGDRRGKPSAA